MPRVKVQPVCCSDQGAHWSAVPCLCDCHYHKDAPCGDAYAVPRVKVQRRKYRPE